MNLYVQVRYNNFVLVNLDVRHRYNNFVLANLNVRHRYNSIVKANDVLARTTYKTLWAFNNYEA